MVGLPDGTHPELDDSPHARAPLRAARSQVPEARAEIGAAQHEVRGEPEHQQAGREIGERHEPASAPAISIGRRAIRRSITAATAPRAT